MAVGATIRKFEVQISNVDEGFYQLVQFSAAQHPSETDDRLVVRALAYCLFAHREPTFGHGLSTPDDPALTVFTLDGQRTLWLDLGAPSLERLHRASKSDVEVVVVTTKNKEALRHFWGSETSTRAETIRVMFVGATLVESLVQVLNRNNAWTFTKQEGSLMVGCGDRFLVDEVRTMSALDVQRVTPTD